jgi:hypothetical protein
MTTAEELAQKATEALDRWNLTATLHYAQESLKHGDTPAAYDMLAVAHYQLGDTQKALEAIEDGLAQFPTYTPLLFQKGLQCLNSGNWEDGWRLWQYRTSRLLHIENIRKVHPGLREWNKLPCGKLLVIGEHGLGDEILFARYLPLVRPFASHMTYLTKKPLKQFFTECGLADEVIDGDDKISLGEFDYWVGLESLPSLLQGVPPQVYPLQPVKSSNKISRVGICWMSSPKPEPHRMMSWPEFAPIVQVPDIEFVNLQYGVECPDIRVQTPKMDTLQDMSEVMNLCDAVVSVDTCVAHMAATKGIETFVLRSLPGEWRWSITGKSLWYPKAHVYLQTTRGSWKDPVEKVIADLSSHPFRSSHLFFPEMASNC